MSASRAPKWRADPALLRNPIHLLAFGFGAGLAPCAPGTFGTLVAVPIVLGVMQFGFAVHLAFAIVASLAGIWLCGESARRLGVHDHPGIVWDEITGYTVTMLAAPPDWYWLAGGFVLFRFFDIRQALADPRGRSQSVRRAGNYAGRHHRGHFRGGDPARDKLLI